MKVRLESNVVRTLPVYGATMGMRVRSVELDRRDVEQLLQLDAETLRGYLLALYTRFPPSFSNPEE